MKQKRVIDGRFGERLRALRIERCLSMEQFCIRLNQQFGTSISKCTVSRYERGIQEPMLNTVELIAKFFNVSPVYLIGQSDIQNVAENVHNSAIVQGNNATTLIVRNGGIHERELNDNEVELLRILEILDVKGRTALLTFAFELEEQQKQRTEN